MKVAVVILNYNGKEDTSQCVQTVLAQKTADFTIELVIVDNASTDGSVNFFSERFPHVTVLKNTKNLGFAGGNNVGIKYILNKGADFVFLLNNDTLLSPDTIQSLINAVAGVEKAGIFGPKIYFTKGHETHPSRYKKNDLGQVLWYAGGKIDWDNVVASHRGVDEVDHQQYEERVKTAFISGCAMLVKREVFEKVGMFDEKYFLYYEDVDLCLRARKKGIEVYYIPQSHLWHKNAGSSGGTGSDMHVYYQARNRLLLGMRYAPIKTKLALYREALNMLINGSVTQKEAIGDFLRRKFGSREKQPLWKLPDINLARFWKKRQEN